MQTCFCRFSISQWLTFYSRETTCVHPRQQSLAFTTKGTGDGFSHSSFCPGAVRIPDDVVPIGRTLHQRDMGHPQELTRQKPLLAASKLWRSALEKGGNSFGVIARRPKLPLLVCFPLEAFAQSGMFTLAQHSLCSRDCQGRSLEGFDLW